MASDFRQAAVTLFECFVLLVIIYYSDWPAYADAARARNQQPPAPRVENTAPGPK